MWHPGRTPTSPPACEKANVGIAYDAALAALTAKRRSWRELRVVGIDVHIGSQITDVEPFVGRA